jgi:DNA-binding PadR family transcriptional regulator
MDNTKAYTRHGKRYYKPYRNYFDTAEETADYPCWERLTKAGLAEKKENARGITYKVTRRGMDWLGQHDGICIYDLR